MMFMQALPVKRNPQTKHQAEKPSEDEIEDPSITQSNNGYDYIINSSTESICMLDPSSQSVKEGQYYWCPSSEEKQLMNELRKLKLKIFDKTELEYVGQTL